MKLEINNKGDHDVVVMTGPESDGITIKTGERITVETGSFCIEVCEVGSVAPKRSILPVKRDETTKSRGL